jgi:hypothetical protein
MSTQLLLVEIESPELFASSGFDYDPTSLCFPSSKDYKFETQFLTF